MWREPGTLPAWRRPPDPLAGLNAAMRAALADGAQTLLVLHAGTYRPLVCAHRPGHAPATIAALVNRGCLMRLGDEAAAATNKGRQLAAVIATRRRARKRWQAERFSR